MSPLRMITKKVTMRVDYDDQLDDLVEKVNTTLIKCGSPLRFEYKDGGDGYVIYELKEVNHE
jgi:hypothetical protein